MVAWNVHTTQTNTNAQFLGAPKGVHGPEQSRHVLRALLQQPVRAQVPQVPAGRHALHAVGRARGPHLPQGVLRVSALQAVVRQGEDVQERQPGYLPELLLSARPTQRSSFLFAVNRAGLFFTFPAGFYGCFFLFNKKFEARITGFFSFFLFFCLSIIVRIWKFLLKKI